MSKKKYNAIDTASSDVSQSFLKGAAILTLSMVIVKVFGLLDKVVLSNIYAMFDKDLASMGMGLYSNAYEIFVVIFTVATGGLPIAISRLVSESVAQKRYKDTKQIYKVSVPFFTIVGAVSLFIMIGGSFFYIQLIESPYSLYAMLCLAPTIMFGCLASIYRGYFEGLRDMKPTAISEIIEAAVKLFIGSALAFVIMYFGMEAYNSTGTFLWFTPANRTEALNTVLAFSVAGAICGISLGSCFSFLFFFIKFRRGGDGIPEEYLVDSVEARTKRETFKRILMTAIPVAAGALVMSLGSLIDQVIIQKVMLNLAETQPDVLYAQYKEFYPRDAIYSSTITIHTRLWGCYSSALTLMQLVTAVTQVFGQSAMPNVTSAWTKGDKNELKQAIETVLRMTMMFTLPMALGLCVLSHEIMAFVYSDAAITQIGGNVLNLMGITTIFTAAITPVCSMLQGIGKVSLPTKLYVLCMCIKIGITWMFVSIPSVNIQGATAGTLISYAIIFVIGMYLLIRYSKIMPNLFGTIIKPLIGAVLSSAAAYFVNILLAGSMNHRLSTTIAIIAAAVVYIVALLILRTFTSAEIKFLPKGEKIAKVLEKYHLIG